MRRSLAVIAVLLTGCVAHFPMPMTAVELSQYDSGPALVAYLGQPDASPVVCDPKARTPHPADYTPELVADLVRGYTDGQIKSSLWRKCVTTLAPTLSTGSATLFDQVLDAYDHILFDGRLVDDPGLTDRLATIQSLYLERSAGLNATPAVATKIADELRDAVAKKRLAPLAAHYASDFLATLDLEKGQWQGRTVDAAMLDTLATEGNEMTLTRLAARLPSAALRDEARRRIVRVHIALSPFDEVRSNAAAVEDTVLKDGFNNIALDAHPLDRAWFDETRTTVRGVLVRQDVLRQTAKLLGYGSRAPSVSVIPEVSFRNMLLAQVDGISRPITLCSRPDDLDPSPCLSVQDISLDNPFAYLDQDAFHFVDSVTMASVVPLAMSDTFALPVRIGGTPAATLQWGLTYERPGNLIFSGTGAGADGPNLGVGVDHRNPHRYVFAASTGAAKFFSVVEATDMTGYQVASAGAQGETGTPGSDGQDGQDGSECGNGSDGSPGGPGGDGGPGGNGGNVNVTVQCTRDACENDLSLLQSVVVSLGGAGGNGGPGGRGGRGGSGGSGRSATTHTDSDGNTVTDDPGCSGGSSGSNGADGAPGSDGPAGSPGTVRFIKKVVKAAPHVASL